MSTFKGVVDEFPELRIDYFRDIPGRTPPLACFLSHIHSDHLRGLETFHSPFVYCSPATRQLLLSLEKYPHRMNFAKGILEVRKQHYRRCGRLLKTIPLNTPTEIELGPQKRIRVTLLDANHCPGAVMFLIEGGGKAILYTGDIRSEPWWVNALLRSPVIVPYTIDCHRLDKIYLDTTFASKDELTKHFPPKAEGLTELLEKISRYPENTTFHFHAWTPGYEDVWTVLSSALGSQIHVDSYKMRLYKSLASASDNGILATEGHALCGFKCGNREQAGCLTSDTNTRLHSCEHDTGCLMLEDPDVVWITPILGRSKDGKELLEVGAGGGSGDLVQSHELELNDEIACMELIQLCTKELGDTQATSKIIQILYNARSSGNKMLSLSSITAACDGEIQLTKLARLLTRLLDQEPGAQSQRRVQSMLLKKSKQAIWSAEADDELPNIIVSR